MKAQPTLNAISVFITMMCGIQSGFGQVGDCPVRFEIDTSHAALVLDVLEDGEISPA